MLEHPKATHDYLGETVSDAPMGNQQGTLTDAEAGWLAGIIDGEGSITMNVRKKSWKGWNGIGVDLQVLLVNTDGLIVDRFVRLAARVIGSEPRVYETRTKELYRQDGSSYHNPIKTLLHVSIARMSSILSFLEAIGPHLAGQKRGRCELAKRFIERRLARKGARTLHGAAWYDAEDWKIVKAFYALKNGRLPPEVEGLLNEHEQKPPLAA